MFLSQAPSAHILHHYHSLRSSHALLTPIPHPPQNDRRVSTQVLRNHMYRPTDEAAGFVNPSFVGGNNGCIAGMVDEVPERDGDSSSRIYAPATHGSRSKDKIYCLQFLKKFLYAYPLD